MTMTVQELITWLNAEKGRKCQFSKLMGRNNTYAQHLCNGISVKNVDMVMAEQCIKEIESKSIITNKDDRIEAFTRLCTRYGMITKLAKYTGTSKQAISRRLRNKQSINDEQWCMIESFAREHGYGL